VRQGSGWLGFREEIRLGLVYLGRFLMGLNVAQIFVC